jgi:ubiquinone/menaquinone biosynthesis C-methylase UbiE
MQSLISKYVKGKTLDIGCGTGQMFQLLESNGITDTYGVDLSDYLAFGRPKEFKSVNLNTEKIPYADNTFDSATSIEVIEHLENPYHYLRESARVLRPGGIFIMSTPNIPHVFNRLTFFKNNQFYRFPNNNNHIMPFVKCILVKGAFPYFSLLETEYIKGEMPLPFLRSFRFPENKLFGRTAVYVFQKKETPSSVAHNDALRGTPMTREAV